MVHSAICTYKYDYGTRNYETADLHSITCHVFIWILSLPSDVSALLPDRSVFWNKIFNLHDPNIKSINDI